MISVVFWGTEKFAAAILEEMIDSGIFEIKLVATRPSRKTGRHQTPEDPPIKKLALQRGLSVVQPENLKNFDPGFSYDLNIIVEYGAIIPKEIIELPKHQSVNIHPSLLPKYRGPSPLQTAILNGDKETGVSIMLIDEKMDHGPILAQERLPIHPDDTLPVLAEKASKIGSKLLIKAIKGYLDGDIQPTPQNDALATVCHILDRDSGRVDFGKKTADEVYNLFRGLSPWPGVWTPWKGKRIKFLEIKKTNKKLNPGQVLADKKDIFIGCRKGAIEILKLQLEGKKPMTAEEFVNGNGNFVGSKL